MNAIALSNRLVRDLNVKSVTDLTADARLEILDAINGGLQCLDSLAPFQTKTTTASLYLEPSVAVTLGVTLGSASVSGYTFTAEHYGRTIRIAGDAIDNQVVGATELLHAYGGVTGSVSAIIFSDAVALPEPYGELVGNPTLLETGRELFHRRVILPVGRHKSVSEPRYYWVEANARNQNPPAPVVIRFDTLPERTYRLAVEVTLAPARITFTDLLAAAADIPLRAEHIEVYLLPVARGILTRSLLWKDKETKAAAREDAKSAEARYELLVPRYLATPNNRSGTPVGF